LQSCESCLDKFTSKTTNDRKYHVFKVDTGKAGAGTRNEDGHQAEQGIAPAVVAGGAGGGGGDEAEWGEQVVHVFQLQRGHSRTEQANGQPAPKMLALFFVTNIFY
jgi:hypothetical protein